MQSIGWIIFRNQRAKTVIKVKPTPIISQIKTNQKPPAKSAIKSSVWDFLDNESEGEDVDENFDDIKSLLFDRDGKLESSLSTITTTKSIEPTIVKPSNATTSDISNYPFQEINCFGIIEIEDPYIFHNENSDDNEDIINDDHIDKLLKSYMIEEEDVAIVDILNQNKLLPKSQNLQKSNTKLKNSNSEVLKESNTNNNNNNNNNNNEEFNLEMKLSRKDKRSETELLFQTIVSYESKQILRYIYNGNPLFCTLISSVPMNTPCCENCGLSRVYEMQLMPALISLINQNSKNNQTIDKCVNNETSSVSELSICNQFNEFLKILDDGIDFGVVLIYCCPNSCVSNNQREYAFVQPPADIGI